MIVKKKAAKDYTAVAPETQWLRQYHVASLLLGVAIFLKATQQKLFHSLF